MQHAMVSAYGWQWKRRRFGGCFAPAYAAAQDREAYTLAQWQHYQQQQVHHLLLHAWDQVPYYRQQFGRQGLTRTQLQQLDPTELHRLPILEKEDLRRYGTSALLAQRRETGGSFFASSGSTGTPTQILFSHAMHQRWMALFERRVRNWAGVTSNMPRGMIGGRRVLPDADHRPPFYRYNLFEKQVYFSAYHISPVNAPGYLNGIRRFGLQYMTGYAMSNYLLAKCFSELGLQAPQLTAVITSSEKLTPAMRQAFREVYGCPTYDGWSGVEACGLITECEQGSLHISPDAGILEVLGHDLRPVPPGTPGTVYCTGLLNIDQPLIRYNIGDQLILSAGACSCGRAMPVVQEILGRTEDVVTGPDGRQMVRFHSIFNGLHTVRQAQVVQETQSRLCIRIVPVAGGAGIEESIIRNRITSQLGPVEVVFEYVSAIPLTANGKYKAVISHLQQPG